MVRDEVSDGIVKSSYCSKANLGLVKVVRRNREAELIKNERHERPIAHVAGDLVRHIHVFKPWNVLHRTQPRNRVQTAASGAEQVIQHPIVPCVPVNETPRYDRADLKPGAKRSRHGCTQQEYVLHDAISAFLREFNKRIEDDPGAQGESDEGDGADTKVSLNEDVRQDTARCPRAIESVGPRVVDQIAKLGEDWDRANQYRPFRDRRLRSTD